MQNKENIYSDYLNRAEIIDKARNNYPSIIEKEPSKSYNMNYISNFEVENYKSAKKIIKSLNPAK